MKKFLFIISAVFASIAIIITLQNAAMYDCAYQVFMDQIVGPLPKPIFIIFLLGFFSGLPLGMAIMMKKGRPDDTASLDF